MQGSFNTHLIGIGCVVFVVATAFIVFNLGGQSYQNSKIQAEKINFVEDQKQSIVVDNLTKKSRMVPSLINQIQKPQISMQSESKKTEVNIHELENKEFSLNLSGTAFLDISSISKDAKLILKMFPVKGTKLQDFTVSDAKLVLDNSAIPVNGIDAHLEGDRIVLTFISKNIGEFSLLATLDESIMSDTNNKQTVTMKDQKFFLVKKETPYRLSMSGTLTD